MALKDDLNAAVAKILREDWSMEPGRVVPEPANLGLGNDATTLTATVLYADLSGSTSMVDTQTATRAAEFYKCYMVCAARIIKNAGGSISAYDGDRIMGIFIGDDRNDAAARTALQINWAVYYVVNPSIKNQYGQTAYQVKHVVGVDTSSVFACRIGVRNDNDLVWVGRAANYAAKLSSIPENNTVFITGDVFDQLATYKYGGNPRTLMWEQRTWEKMPGLRLYRSTWTWGI
jgi:class 3 adenylate cyclase